MIFLWRRLKDLVPFSDEDSLVLEDLYWNYQTSMKLFSKMKRFKDVEVSFGTLRFDFKEMVIENNPPMYVSRNFITAMDMHDHFRHDYSRIVVCIYIYI